MRASMIWTDRLQDTTGNAKPIHAITWITINHLLAGTGSLLLLYDTLNGTLLNTLSIHKDTVYALANSSSNDLAASGGADKTVILWQCLAFSPISGVLCSGTASEFGLWNPESRTVTKSKVSSKINACAWSSDGQYFALGMENGSVSIRTNSGIEHVLIERSPAAPVWSLAWNPNLSLLQSTDDPKAPPVLSKRGSTPNRSEKLLVADWNQRASIYLHSGELIGSEQRIGCDPTSISYAQNGKYFLIADTNGVINFWDSYRDTPVKICPVFEQKNAWIWSVSMSPTGHYFSVATEQGDISVYQLSFQTVHALYQSRYAFRSGLTDVVIQHFDNHLGQTQSCRLSCRDYVRKIALFRNKFAVSLSSRILVYEYVPRAEEGFSSNSNLSHQFLTAQSSSLLRKKSQQTLEYRLYNKINLALECNLLVMTSQHLLFCIESKLLLYDLNGKKEREWRFTALIGYIKVVGGPVCKESIIIGMRNGWTYLIYLDNPFPIPIVQLATAIRCIDMNRDRTKIAVLDDSETCAVYSLNNFDNAPKLEFQETGATSVSWNTDHDDLLCYSGKNTVAVKAGTFPSMKQPNAGFVVGFKGPKLFILHQFKLSVIQVPLSLCMYQYIDRKIWSYATSVTDFGAGGDCEWVKLGRAALEDMQMNVSRRCFARVKDCRTLIQIGLIHNINKTGGSSNDAAVAHVLAMHGKFDQAASKLSSKGLSSEAVNMYTELGMYEPALKIARAYSLNDEIILKNKAAALHGQNNHQAAADAYLQAGDITQAIKLLIVNTATEQLVLIVQTFSDSMDTAALLSCGQYFKTQNRTDMLALVLRKLGDWKSLVALYVSQQDFDSAFAITRDHAFLEPDVDLPFAQHLLIQQDYDGAQAYFKKAGRPDLAVSLLKQLQTSAIAQQCYLDAAKASFQLGEQLLADTLYAYHSISNYLSDPFTSLPTSTLLSMARFLVIQMHQPTSICKNSAWIPSLARGPIFVAMARLTHALNAFNLCVDVVRMASNYSMPTKWQMLLDSVYMQCVCHLGPSEHNECSDDNGDDLIHLCFACSEPMALLTINPQCKRCHVPATYAFHSFDPLPVIQFVINDTPDPNTEGTSTNVPCFNEVDDPFLQFIALNNTINEYPIRVDKYTASRFKAEKVIRLGPLMFYRVLTDVAIKTCPGCSRFFHADVYEFLQLTHNGCPLCHHDDYGLRNTTHNTLEEYKVKRHGQGV